MSNKTYVIKEGDQLLKIALEQGVNYIDLLELNPAYQANPNLIHSGETLILSAEEETVEEPETKPAIAEPAGSSIPAEGCLQGKPACQGEDVCDVLVFSDDEPEHYYVLTTKEQQSLVLEEAEQMSVLAADFYDLTMAAPKSDSADKAAIEAHRAKKQKWLERAYQSNVLSPEKLTEESKTHQNKSNDDFAANKIANLTERKQILGGYYSDNYFWGDPESVKTFRDRLIADINKEIAEFERIRENASKESGVKENGSSNAQTVGRDSSTTNKKGSETRVKAGFREAVLISQNKVIYVRVSFLENQKANWRKVSSSPSLKAALLSKKDGKALLGAMLKDIKRDIVKGANGGLFNNLEGTLYSNKLMDEKFKEWKFKVDSAGSSSEDANFAVSGEAQLARFCFHTDAKSLVKPKDGEKNGEVDLGISAGAEMSLLEGKIEASACLPHRRGYYLYITYLDASGKDVQYPFGQFRAELKLVLSCFVGATGSVGATATVHTKPKEQSSGLSALVGSGMNLDVDNKAGGALTVKGEGFAGAQAGGQVSGALQWEAPENIGKDKFDALVEVVASGNVAFGAGAGVEFTLKLTPDGFELHCSASMVLGPGGSGGFGAKVDFTKLWPLAKVIWGALAVADYRTLQCVDEVAYRYLSRAAYYFFTVPSEALEDAVGKGFEFIDSWWDEQAAVWSDRELRCAEAKQLAKTILDGQGKYSGVDQNQLQPETIGMLMDTLVQTFYWNSEEQQEKAIVMLLTGSIGHSWRKFEEVLAHMNPQGKKQSGDQALFDNLDRINAILAGDQQEQFNDWIKWLSEGEDDINQRYLLAFTYKTGPAFQNKLSLVAQQISDVPSFYA
ncbi:LysM domain-containing protein [Marinomonas alcarazii]|uniref:LysM domain-containing protein n=1 Tax=Marinomonas alcarazii TaxID=491949 RepID=A0A318UN03_9GAMM|nr:LysM domain-containing protein [Marinomonas alcarazii]PYF77792.1 LysM domain-containing protein [Marinomonas alcarazii]